MKGQRNEIRGGSPASAQRLIPGLERVAASARRRAEDWMVSF